MNRYAFILNAVRSPERTPLIEITRMLAATLEQHDGQGTDAYLDPAVAVLGAWIAFHTDADINTRDNYTALIHQCHELLHTPVVTQ